MEPDIEQKLKVLCAQNLAAYKIPRKFICVTYNLPTTATGKVDKKVLRKKNMESRNE
jgi:non-ribosomal peptide synthetase component E (peptide arylation enzyme)